MNNKPQQPRFDPTRLGLPKDIAQVIERLKARGLVKVRTDLRAADYTVPKTERVLCKWCGELRSKVYGAHMCKPQRASLKHI